MTMANLIAALALPANTRVDQRVPKKLLLENGAPTSADKRNIQDGIEEMFWLASLKPSNIGVAEFITAEREYLEIAVVSACFRPQAKAVRLIELIHRAIPYPVVLVSEQAGELTLSLAHKRLSQAEAGKGVLESSPVVVSLSGELASQPEKDFIASLLLASQPAANLFTLYQGWQDRISDLFTARITGSFTVSATTAVAEAKCAALAEYTALKQEIAALRAQAEKETQLSRRVDLNLQLQRMHGRLAQVKDCLGK